MALSVVYNKREKGWGAEMLISVCVSSLAGSRFSCIQDSWLRWIFTKHPDHIYPTLDFKKCGQMSKEWSVL